MTAPTSERPREVGPPPPVPRVAGWLALASATATTTCWVLAALIVTVQRGELHDWITGAEPTTTSWIVAAVLLGFGYLALVAGWVTTGWWLLELRKVADWVRPEAWHRRADWWAIVAWVVPIANLWFPYQVVADTSRALGSRARRVWPWWIAFLLLGAGSVLDQQRGTLGAAGIDRWILSLQVNALIVIVACVLWWRIVRAATAAAVAAATVEP